MWGFFFLLILIPPGKEDEVSMKKSWNFFTYVDFNSTSLIGLCIFVKIRKKKMTETWNKL